MTNAVLGLPNPSRLSIALSEDTTLAFFWKDRKISFLAIL
jgi:hypothetical protein